MKMMVALWFFVVGIVSELAASVVRPVRALPAAFRLTWAKFGVAAFSLGVGIAHATGTDPFDAAMSSATDKVATYASALVGLAAVSVIFMIGMKYVKKLPRAA